MANVIIQKQDNRLFVENPKDFNPARNKAIVEETIRETTKFFQDMENAVDEGLRERIDMVGTYGRYRFNQGTKSFEDYVGKQLYRQVIGEKILQKVKAMDSVNRLNGNTGRFGKTILL